MNDYFDALLSASGIAASPPAARAADPRPAQAPDFGIEELIDARPQPAAVLLPRADERPRPIAGTAQRDGAVANESAGGRAGLRPWPVPATETTVSAPSGSADLGPAPAAAPFVAPQPKRAPAEEMVDPVPPEHDAVMQAALRWVASADRVAEAMPAPAAKPMPDGGSADAHAAAYRVQVREPADPAPEVARAMALDDIASAVGTTVVQMRDAFTPSRAQADDGRVPGPVAASADGVGAGPAEDVVQISIGTIHVRVDAAPPPAVSVAPPPLAPMALPSQQAPRSGLSRRALRRI